ncbi:hypothetical protein C2E23DRAFT_887850 [Lenzites betulinus]|nr:hypothetical protein C2E23DRAFT_887850 [Lenzites betulinus]
MSSPTPKSCLKRNSLPSGAPHPFFEDTARRCASPESNASPSESSSFSSGSSFSSTSSTASASPIPGSGLPTTFTSVPAPPGHHLPRGRAKSVSFSEDDDVWVYKPFTDPLHKQAAKKVARLFRACADALRIEPPADESPMFRHNLIATYSGRTVEE